MSNEGAKYTDQQTYRYLERINFPLSTPLSFPPPNLDTLRRLIACHLHTIPFENLSLHYSKRRAIALEPEFLFDKFVNQCKGGYCMEQNGAFSTLLRTLGYNLYTIGARVFHSQDRGQVRGFGHMAIILTLDNVEYLVDVGFGGAGLTAPLPIFNGQVIEDPIKGLIPEEHRIHRAEIPGAAKKGHKSWMFQSRRNPQSEWETQYAFEKDFEFFGPDYEIMNMNTSQSSESPFLNILVCTNVDYNDKLEAISRTILVNLDLKRRRNGETKCIATFDTEEERVEALEKEFGIHLTTEEKDGIKGSRLAVDNFDRHTKQSVF